ISQVRVERGVAALKLDGQADAFDGSLMVAALRAKHAPKVPGRRMIRIGCQDLPVQFVGSLQATRSMMLKRQRKRLVNGNGSHSVPIDAVSRQSGGSSTRGNKRCQVLSSRPSRFSTLATLASRAPG